MTVHTDAGCDSGLWCADVLLDGDGVRADDRAVHVGAATCTDGGVLHLIARLLALADRLPRRIAAPKPPSLTALQIIRI